MTSFFNRRLVYLYTVIFLVAMGFSTANAKVDCDKRPDHPACADTDDGTVQLGSGDDVWPGAGDDNTGDDVVFGGDGWDEIFGGQGNDDLYGEAGNDYLDGQAGDDRLNGGDGVDDLYGGVGNDQFYVDGSDNGDFADGGEGYDSLYLDFLDTVTVWFENPDDPDSVGVYRGSYYVKRAGTFEVEGYFKNIEFLYGSTLDGIYHGNNLANTIWGREGNDTIYGYGGDDYLRGGGMTLSQTDHIGDYIDGGEGNDRINGMIGDDYIIGGPGHDEIWIHDNGNHDTVEDFEIGDKIVIYNSNICWPDLTVTTVDSGGDENVADTLVAWRVKNKSNSITLLDFPLSQLSKDDFVFEVEGEIPTYSGCP